jgi:tRNA 2-thiouridine synthesizing protein A
MKIMVNFVLDTLGLKCPLPILKAKKIIKKMNSGETMELISDDTGAKADVPALLRKTDCTLLELKEEGEKLTFLIKKD